MSKSNAEAGVDYSAIKPFKNLMQGVASRTRMLPIDRGIEVIPIKNGHAGCYRYAATYSHCWVTTKEGLGNKAWIAMMMDHLGVKDPTGNYWFGGIGIDTFLMGANDNATHGGMPVIVTDEVSCGSDEFFSSPQAIALADSFERACNMTGCALVQGESPAYKYLMNPAPPVKFAPSLSVNVIGLVAPTKRLVRGSVMPGDIIIGFPSSGLHANGISPVIKKVMQLPDGFSTECNGRTIGEEALIPTRSYVGLVEALLDKVQVHAFRPITGGGASKIGVGNDFHYFIRSWPTLEGLSPLFWFMHERCLILKRDLLETFNCDVGYVAIVPKDQADLAVEISRRTQIDGESGTYNGVIIGEVQTGKPGVYVANWDEYFPGQH